MNHKPYILHVPNLKMSLGFVVDEQRSVFLAVSMCHGKDTFRRRTSFDKVSGKLASPNFVEEDHAFVAPFQDSAVPAYMMKIGLEKYGGENPSEDIYKPLRDALGKFKSRKRRNADSTVRFIMRALNGAILRANLQKEEANA